MIGLLNADEAAALLNVPATWVLAEARADRIPHVRLGRYVRFEAELLEAWWRARLRGPATFPDSKTKRPRDAQTSGARPTGGLVP